MLLEGEAGVGSRVRGDFLGTDVDVGIKRVIDYVSREGRFERGLERLLDGIEAHVAAERAGNGAGKSSK